MSKYTKKAVGFGVPFVDIPQLAKTFDSAPTASDKNFPLGFEWIYIIDADNRATYIFTGLDSSGDAIWNLASPGASDVDTLTGDSGTASPSSGNINILGGTNITTTGASPTGDDLTIDLDAAIVLVTSVSAPLYTVAAGNDLDITSASGQDVVMKLGDNGGSNKFSITDSDDSEVFSVDSDGNISFTNFSNTGTFTTAGGLASINASSNFNTVINSGTSTGTVTIGNSAAGAITLDTAAGISLGAATASDFTVTGAAADLTLSSVGGSINITATEDDAGAILIEADGGTSEKITIHADQGTAVDSIALTSDDGGITLTAGLASSDGINFVSSAGGIDMDAALDVVITSTEDASESIYLHANGGTSETIRIHADQGTSVTSIDLLSDVGGISLTATGLASADAINLDATAGGIDMDGALQINIASSQNAADAIRINASAGGIDIDAAGGAGEDITLDNAAGSIGLTAGEADAAAISLQAASGGLDIDTGLAIIGDAAGNIELNSSAGTILIGNDDVDQNIELGTDGERTVTVGSVNGAAALVLQAGTGEITVTGTVKEVDAEFLEASGDEISSFSQSPVLTTAANTAGAATGANGDVNLMYCQQGVLLEQFIIGTQTIIGPRMDSNGLLVSLDLTAAEGAEYNFGAARTNSRHAFVIGTDAAFFFEVGLYINDMDGADPYVIGFRKSEANNATFGSYSDYAAIGMLASSSTTNIVTLTELNGGGQTITNTTDAWGGDGSTNTLKVLVDASGNVTYTIGGSAPSSSAAFQFDSGDTVCPFIHLLHSASATQVDITSLKVGYQA